MTKRFELNVSDKMNDVIYKLAMRHNRSPERVFALAISVLDTLSDRLDGGAKVEISGNGIDGLEILDLPR